MKLWLHKAGSTLPGFAPVIGRSLRPSQFQIVFNDYNARRGIVKGSAENTVHICTVFLKALRHKGFRRRKNRPERGFSRGKRGFGGVNQCPGGVGAASSDAAS